MGTWKEYCRIEIGEKYGVYSIIGDFNARTEKEKGVGLEEIVKKEVREREGSQIAR